MKYSTHSIRIWKCVSLDEAGNASRFIEKRLRWMGKSYHMHMRDTHKINEHHNIVLKESSQAVVDLIDSNLHNQIQTLSDKDREESGEYDDED